MNKNKIFEKIFSLCFVFLFAFSVNTIFAETAAEPTITNLDEQINTNDESNNDKIETLIDTEALNSVYRFSDHKSPYLPFVRFCSDRIVVDSDVSKSGILFSQRSIDIQNKMQKVQILFASESVRINENMDYALIFAGTNTIIDSTINGDVLVFSGDTITISETGKVNGDIIVFAPAVDIKGSVQGSVIGSANTVKVSGTIQNDLRMETINVTLGDTSVFGNVYISTNNKDLNLGESYSNATIKIIENSENVKFDLKNVLLTGVVSSIIFAIMFFAINRRSKGKLYELTLNKIKENSMFMVVFGCFFVILLPLVITLLFLLSVLGAYAITVPIMILVLAYALIFGLLSTFVVGSVMAHYMSERYYKEQNSYIKVFAAFIMFFVLHILARLPKVGGYISIILVILSYGIVATIIFTKKNKKEEIIEETLEKVSKDGKNQD